MGAVTPGFTSLNDELLEDSISPEDINEVLQQARNSSRPAPKILLNEEVSFSADEDDDRHPGRGRSSTFRPVLWIRRRTRSGSTCAKWVW